MFHPDGTLNLFAHAPVNAAPSDLTPKLMASWETDAATATTKIQSELRGAHHVPKLVRTDKLEIL